MLPPGSRKWQLNNLNFILYPFKCLLKNIVISLYLGSLVVWWYEKMGGAIDRQTTQRAKASTVINGFCNSHCYVNTALMTYSLFVGRHGLFQGPWVLRD
jgi:hypothetical protein